MQAGRLRHIIKIKELTRVKNNYGGYDDTFTDLETARANVAVINGTEIVKAGGALTQETLSILMRKNSVLTEGKHIEWNGNTYRVSIIKPDTKGMQLTVTATRDF